jgi:hypothetical protein
MRNWMTRAVGWVTAATPIVLFMARATGKKW